MKSVLTLSLFFPLILFAQKKPLDHSVYDSWQSIGERTISKDGKWVVYTITPQEGDAGLFIQSADGSSYRQVVPRGYNAVISEDSRYVVFKIKPRYSDTRQARIKKKKPEDFPKDSLGLVELGKSAVFKVAKVKSYKTPSKAGGWLAYQKDKEPVPTKGNLGSTQKTVDSLKRTIDSLLLLVKEFRNANAGSADASDANEDPSTAGNGTTEGSDLVVRKLESGKEQVFKNVVDYLFNAYGQKLLMYVTRSPRDSASANAVVIYDLAKGRLDTILKGGNDFKNFVFTEDGSKAAFVAERDTNTRALQKFYQLYVYQSGDDSAQVVIDQTTMGMKLGTKVSEFADLAFSKSGNRLLFGTTPVTPPRDTSLIDIDLVKLDVWHYNDDFLQTQQLNALTRDLRRSHLAVYDFARNRMVQMGSREFPMVYQTGEGDGRYFYAVTDTGRRVARQWGVVKADIYSINTVTGAQTLIKRNHEGSLYPSSTGRYVLLFDNKLGHYFLWNGKTLTNLTAAIKVPLYNEEHDTPSSPGAYGVMGWQHKDSFVYVYDRYDVWKIDPANPEQPKRITSGRAAKVQYRYLKVAPEERFFTVTQHFYFKGFNQSSKNSFIARTSAAHPGKWEYIAPNEAAAYDLFVKAGEADVYLYSAESFRQSPDLYATSEILRSTAFQGSSAGEGAGVKLTSLNPQQAEYNWGTAELYKWKAFNGKAATGILYKPEDFNPARKYPMIIYFYEKMSDGLNNYIEPAPTPSRLNIPFFVSRGYLVFTPDIVYAKGQPAKDAYDYIVSGAQALSKNKWVDAKNIGIQGQSWGGYQVMALIVRTGMFKAAWAGAPVVNMTSAYGGIRWESGNNRQMQYEKGQSRIGASLWDSPKAYIENSPLFQLPKVTTPLVIMANDADGAVPWYQGIELFTAMRRLNKKVWMLNYNGEAHNLVERKNRKDIQVREQQFFDWLLKGEKPAQWLTEGIPAVKKGKTWGLDLVD